MTAQRWILRNIARRPIELHQPSGKVSVVAPGAAFEVDELDAQCRALLRRGALTRHLPPVADAPEAPAERDAQTRKPAKSKNGARRKSGAGKSTGADA